MILEALQPPYFEHLSLLIHSPAFQEKVLHIEQTAYENFACTQCGDCCRSPWKIFLTKAYYDKWFSIFDQDPSGRFKAPFLKLETPKPEHYADMRRGEANKCIFLESDETCFIHNNYGESALSHVCKQYPRGNKRIQNMVSTNVLLSSCEAVPDTWQNHKGLKYAWYSYEPGKRVKHNNFSVPYHLKLSAHFLWLGLCFDVIEAAAPSSVLQRWWVLQDVLKDLPDDVSTTRISHWEHYRSQTEQALAFYFPTPASADSYQEAATLVFNLLPHPGCQRWLLRALKGKQRLPDVTLVSQQRMDDYFKSYLQSRLLAVSYGDLFWGEVNYWEQNLILVTEAVAIQTLARYHAFTDGLDVQFYHLQRASVSWTKICGQKRDFLDHLKIKGITPEAAKHAISLMLHFESGLYTKFIQVEKTEILQRP